MENKDTELRSEPKGETFESLFPSLQKYSIFLNKLDFATEIKELLIKNCIDKQLHDKQILDLNTEIYETKDWLCGIIGKQKLKKDEKDKQIFELQLELQELKIRHHCR